MGAGDKGHFAQGRLPAPLPRWLGPTWLFIVFIEAGWHWNSLLLYGGVPWLGAWLVWQQLARTRYFLEMPSASVDAFWRWISRMLWVAVILLMGSIYYVNHYLPRSDAMVDTGDVVCENDDRGPCGEQYKEDVRGLEIPGWAKLLKTDEAFLFLLGLVLAGGIASSRPQGGYGR